jgi:polar amino acid transport system substrate-binding protein
MKTHTAGVLTASTDEPVYEPWFVDDKPENGKGFESAVAYAVAAKLGYSKDKVTWVRTPFNKAISPAPKDYDFDINEFSITPDRAKVVDFSSGYYDVAQAVVTTKTSKIAHATSIADLKDAKLGAQIGTTSLDAINNQIKPSSEPAVFQTNDAAVKALQNGQIDGVVTDLPTAFYMAGAQLGDAGMIVGQLPVNEAQPEQFGMLLDKGSSLTSCISAAVDALRADGTLDALQKQWLAEAGAPVLK